MVEGWELRERLKEPFTNRNCQPQKKYIYIHNDEGKICGLQCCDSEYFDSLKQNLLQSYTSNLSNYRPFEKPTHGEFTYTSADTSC